MIVEFDHAVLFQIEVSFPGVIDEPDITQYYDFCHWVKESEIQIHVSQTFDYLYKLTLADNTAAVNNTAVTFQLNSDNDLQLLKSKLPEKVKLLTDDKGIFLIPLPEGVHRVETGAVQFGDDWPGIFIRGDHACSSGFALTSILNSVENDEMLDFIQVAYLRGLASTLQSCRV